MASTHGIVYFDGERDYVFSLKNGSLTNSNVDVVSDFDRFKRQSLDLLLEKSGVRTVSAPIEDDKVTQGVFDSFDGLDNVRVVRHGSEVIEDLVQKSYDTGYFSGKGEDGSSSHKVAIQARQLAKDKLLKALFGIE